MLLKLNQWSSGISRWQIVLDRDHIVEQTGYSNPMTLLAGQLLLQVLSSVDGVHLLGLEITPQERQQATTPDAMRRLLLAKLQERF